CSYTCCCLVITQSSQGESRGSGAGRSAVWKISRAQIICIHVVPLLDRVLMTMSPGRNGNASQRPLSSSSERYRTGVDIRASLEDRDARTPLRFLTDVEDPLTVVDGTLEHRDCIINPASPLSMRHRGVGAVHGLV